MKTVLPRRNEMETGALCVLCGELGSSLFFRVISCNSWLKNSSSAEICPNLVRPPIVPYGTFPLAVEGESKSMYQVEG